MGNVLITISYNEMINARKEKRLGEDEVGPNYSSPRRISVRAFFMSDRVCLDHWAL